MRNLICVWIYRPRIHLTISDCSTNVARKTTWGQNVGCRLAKTVKHQNNFMVGLDISRVERQGKTQHTRVEPCRPNNKTVSLRKPTRIRMLANNQKVRRWDIVIAYNHPSWMWLRVEEVLGMPTDLTCSQEGCVDVSVSLYKMYNNQLNIKF